ncbi:MAG: ISAs1 family transposase, partial [Gammaproteobacteria bacterium]
MAMPKELKHFLDHFEDLEDPRMERTRLHPLPEILLTTVCGVFAGCEGWNEIEAFGRVRLELLRQYLPFENGMPSDDTLRRVFRALDPGQFQQCFQSWCRNWFVLHDGSQIAIDGKTLRGSRDGDRQALHLVSAFATEA